MPERSKSAKTQKEKAEKKNLNKTKKIQHLGASTATYDITSPLPPRSVRDSEADIRLAAKRPFSAKRYPIESTRSIKQSRANKHAPCCASLQARHYFFYFIFFCDILFQQPRGAALPVSGAAIFILRWAPVIYNTEDNFTRGRRKMHYCFIFCFRHGITSRPFWVLMEGKKRKRKRTVIVFFFV